MEDFTLLLIAIIVLFALLVSTIGSFLYICGVLKPIDVGAGSPPIEDVVIAYKFGKGPYKDCGALFQDAVNFSPLNSRTIGIYYDNPKVIPSEKLRYAVGAILSEGGIKVEKEVEEKLLAEGFKLIKLPKVNHCVKTDFPFINVMSIMIAVWRVYPRMSQYIKDNALCAYPMIEVYDSTKIHYMAPLSQQEDFYVPEAKENIPEEYLNNSELSSSFDRSLLNDTRDSADRSSVGSSVSCSTTFSRSYASSRFGDENFSDIEEDSDVQDDQISSSIDVRPSKACTNLLQEAKHQESEQTSEQMKGTKSDLNDSGKSAAADESMKEDGTSLTEEEMLGDLHFTGGNVNKDTSIPSANSSGVLQDSGIGSGRTSASPTDSLTEDLIKASGDQEGEDSESSFEEIKMDQVKQEIPEQ